MVSKVEKEVDERLEEWDSEPDTVGFSNGGVSEEEDAVAVTQPPVNPRRPGSDEKSIQLDPEPQLTADQYVAPGDVSPSILMV